MDEQEARSVIRAALASIAADVDPDSIDPAADLREEADLDSIDFLELVEAVVGTTGCDIPESDYRRIGTLEEFAHYLAGTTVRSKGASLRPEDDR